MLHNHSPWVWQFCAPLILGVLLVGCKHDDIGSTGSADDFGSPVGAQTATPPSERPIAVGDRLEVFVDEDPTFNDVYIVREGGDVIIPNLGRIKVEGLSVKGAESRIAATLKKGILANPTLIVDRLADERGKRGSQNSVKVYLTGKVASPGMHQVPFEPGQKLGAYEALLIGGGMSKFGDDRTAHILRAQPTGRRVKIPLDIRGINQGTASDVPVAEGDIIVIPEKVFGF